MQGLNQEVAHASYAYSFVSDEDLPSIKQNGAGVHNARGIAHAKNGEYNLSITDFNKAIELDSNYADAYCNRGIAYDIKGECDLAIKDYTVAIQLKPDCAEAYNNRGNAYCEKGEIDKAIADYTEAIVLKPKIAVSYYTRGETWLRAKEWEKAKMDLTAAILQDVDIADLFHSRHGSIAAFEQKIDVKLPKDVVYLLTPLKGPFEIDKETRVALAMKYYENEELSGGLAARLAGVSREAFMYLMGDYGLSPLGTAEELRKSGF